MKHVFKKIAIATTIGLSVVALHVQAQEVKRVGSLPIIKNWTPPNYKMLSQQIVDDTMAKHPELQSLTLQGVPPGFKPDEIRGTMFAGSFPDRIGKISADVDVTIIEKGYTSIDPRWKKNDVPPKYIVLSSLRDKNNNHIGLAVIVFKDPKARGKTEKDLYLASLAIRDEMAARIPSHAAMFEPASK